MAPGEVFICSVCRFFKQLLTNAVSNRLRAHWTRLRLQGDQRVLTNYRQQKCWKY